jgi:RNA polymerase sigma-70 factor (ECF subfamily)
VPIAPLAPATKTAVPFDEIAGIVDRSPEATRQLASRARRRVRGARPSPDPDMAAQREVVDAFLAAAREGDFEGLVAVLDENAVLRADRGAVPAGVQSEVRGAANIARQALMYSRLDLEVRPALVNGAAGTVTLRDGEVFAVTGFTVRDHRIVEMDILADPERLRELDLTMLDD